MAAWDSLKVCLSRQPSGLLLAALMILLSSTLGFTRELPRVELMCPPDTQQPAVPFERGVIDTIEWYLEHMDWVEDIETGRYLEYQSQG